MVGPCIYSPFRGHTSTGPMAVSGGFIPLPGAHLRLDHIYFVYNMFNNCTDIVIVFIDESGIESRCNCVSLGAVVLTARGESYLEVGRYLVNGIKRPLKRRAETARCIEEEKSGVRHRAHKGGRRREICSLPIHRRRRIGVEGEGACIRRQASRRERLARAAGHLAVAEDSTNFSRKVGIRLADVVAGYARLCDRLI